MLILAQTLAKVYLLSSTDDSCGANVRVVHERLDEMYPDHIKPSLVGRKSRGGPHTVRQSHGHGLPFCYLNTQSCIARRVL
jgi:hypothetical protein